MTASSLPLPTCPDPALRKIGWAGFLMDCPRNLRFARVEGDARQGKLTLADEQRHRLDLAWGRVRPRQYDGQAFAIKRLRRAAGKKKIDDQVALVDNSQFQPLLHLADPQGKLDRYAGYHPVTHRVIEIAYHRQSPAEDRLIHRHLAPGLIDQPISLPSHWAFFDVSFTTPPGFRYESSRLNLGDMRVRLIAGNRLWNGPRITIGQIYPARLALMRQDLPQWARNLCEEMKGHYRPDRGATLQVRVGQTDQSDPLALADMRLRKRFSLLLWKTPRPLRMHVIHHLLEDRLTFINITDNVLDRINEHFDFVRESLHWAGLAD